LAGSFGLTVYDLTQQHTDGDVAALGFMAQELAGFIAMPLMLQGGFVATLASQ
jgi:hypothetical protein